MGNSIVETTYASGPIFSKDWLNITHSRNRVIIGNRTFASELGRIREEKLLEASLLLRNSCKTVKYNTDLLTASYYVIEINCISNISELLIID